MPTGVANTRESIVFSVEVDDAATRAAACLEGCGDAVGVAGHREALSLKKITDCVVSFVLPKGEFGVGPDLGWSERLTALRMALPTWWLTLDNSFLDSEINLSMTPLNSSGLGAAMAILPR